MTKNSKFVHVIPFHGIDLWVVEYEGVEYVPAKPLAEIAKVEWKRGRKTFFSGDNPKLYGTKELENPVFNGDSTPYGRKKQVYIRLDRSTMYLARVNTARMRVNNKVEAADKLLALQLEWAGALHDYETKGVARKRGRTDRLSLMMTRLEKMNNSTMKTILAREINEEFDIHIPLADQNELKLG